MLGTWVQRAAVAAVALCAGLGWCQPSYAGAGATVTTTALHARSGEWGVVTSATSFGFTQSTQRFFFTASNVGTLPLRGATYTMSIAGLKTGNFWILACVGGTWNTATGVCIGGTQQVIGSTIAAATSVTATAPGTYPTAPRSAVTLQAYVDKVAPKATATISVAVNRAQVRAPVTTNA